MHSKDFNILLQSWLRLPSKQIDAALAGLRAQGGFPKASTQLSYLNAANGLIAVVAASLDQAVIAEKKLLSICTMSLQGDVGKDPLNESSRNAFCLLVGESLGINSMNGYLNFGECLAESFIRQKGNLNQIELNAVTLKFYGKNVGGEISARLPDGKTFSFAFTPQGDRLQTKGIERTASLNRAILSGVAFVVEADGLRAASNRSLAKEN